LVQRKPDCFVNRLGKAAPFRRLQAARFSSRVNPGAKECFGRMDVAQTRDSMLVHQRHLDRLLGRTNRLFELRSSEAIGQRIPTQVLDHLQPIQSVRLSRLDPAEHPWVPKVNHLPIVKQQPRAAVRLTLSAGPMNEFASHSKVSEKAAVLLEPQQQILPSPSGAQQLAANLPELLAIGSSKNPRPFGFGSYHLAVAKPLLQIPPFDFNFRQFRHAKSFAFPPLGRKRF
jgi:hypothetical protein